MINLVEWATDENKQKPAPCSWGNIVEGHACYCHNEKAPYRKCPIWRMGYEWNRENCEFFNAADAGQGVTEKEKA